MSRLLTSITSFAACVVGGQAMQKFAVPTEEDNSTLDPFENLFNGEQDNTPNQVVTPDKQVSYLEEGFFDAFVNVYDGVIDQSNATRFIDACKWLKVDLAKMGHIKNASKLLARIEHNRLQVYKAQHLKSLFENGSMPQGPNRIFFINETGPFQPPWGLHPMELAEWYMSKIASLDAMSARAILTKEGLDMTYHYARQFELAIGVVLKRNVMSKPDAETSLAKKTMDALSTHLAHLEVRLHTGGAIPGAYLKRANQTAAEVEGSSVNILDGTLHVDSEVVNNVNEDQPGDLDLHQGTAVDSVREEELAAASSVSEENTAAGAVGKETASNPSFNVADLDDKRRALLESLGLHYP